MKKLNPIAVFLLICFSFNVHGIEINCKLSNVSADEKIKYYNNLTLIINKDNSATLMIKKETVAYEFRSLCDFSADRKECLSDHYKKDLKMIRNDDIHVEYQDKVGIDINTYKLNKKTGKLIEFQWEKYVVETQSNKDFSFKKEVTKTAYRQFGKREFTCE